VHTEVTIEVMMKVLTKVNSEVMRKDRSNVYSGI
jgi:hypothetical protein